MVLRLEFTVDKPFWIISDHSKCSGCRRCEITCSLHHEGSIWPEASMVRVFMLITGADVPHLCAQSEDHPFVDSCPVDVMSVNPEMKSIEDDREKCTVFGNCNAAYSAGSFTSYLRRAMPSSATPVGSDPHCVRTCHEGRWDCLYLVKREETHAYRLIGWKGSRYKGRGQRDQGVLRAF